MPVSILDAVIEQDDFPGNGVNFSPSAGDRRCVYMVIGHEIDGSVTAGPISISSLTLGGQAMVAQHEHQIGADDAYHNYIGVWTLNEAGIAAMSGNALSITWVNSGGTGAFGQAGNQDPFVQYCCLQDVDQANINSGEGDNNNAAASSLSPSATVNIALDEFFICGFVAGQPGALSTTAGSMTEQSDQQGITNAMCLGIYFRDATSADAAYTWTVNCATSTRLTMHGMAFGFDPGALEREQETFRFYEDGTEAGATALETQDTDLTIGREVTFGLRVGTQMVDDPPAESVTVEYKESGDAAAEYRKLL